MEPMEYEPSPSLTVNLGRDGGGLFLPWTSLTWFCFDPPHCWQNLPLTPATVNQCGLVLLQMPGRGWGAGIKPAHTCPYRPAVHSSELLHSSSLLIFPRKRWLHICHWILDLFDIQFVLLCVGHFRAYWEKIFILPSRSS